MKINNFLKSFGRRSVFIFISILVLSIFAYTYAASSGTGSVTVLIPPGFQGGSVTVTVQGVDTKGTVSTADDTPMNPVPKEITIASSVWCVDIKAVPPGAFSISDPASDRTTILEWNTNCGDINPTIPDSCVATGTDWSGAKDPLGGNQTTTLTKAKTYVFGIRCKKAGLPDTTDSVSVVVNPASTLVCSPSSQTGAVNENLTFNVAGGNGVYAWNASGAGISSGSGNSFNTYYSTSGSKVVVVTSDGKTASCSVNISQSLTCTAGATQSCSASNFCGMTNTGTQSCVNGAWSGCSVSAPADSMCTNSNSCGSASGGAPSSTPPTSNLCTTGSASSVNLDAVNSTYVWGCGSSVCSTPYNGPINALCGAAQSTEGPEMPSGSANFFCYQGSSSGLTPVGDGSYSWTCSGINGGSNASCSNYPTNSTCDFISANSSGLILSWETNNNCDAVSLLGPNGGMQNLYTDPDTGITTSISWPQKKSMTVSPGTYRIIANGAPYAGHKGTAERTVLVGGGSISASPTSIFTGESTTLTWSSQLHPSCTGTNFSTGGTNSGSLVVKPASTITYSVNCGGVISSVTVTVKKRPGFIEN
jgi:hypothetical protein